MKYYNPVVDSNGYVYSCDSIRLEVSLVDDSDLFIIFTDLCLSMCDTHYLSWSFLSYRYVCNFVLSSGADGVVSFSILIGFNGAGKLRPCFVVDFNPNKCMHFDKFNKIIAKLFRFLRGYRDYEVIRDMRVKRYDLAIDIPCLRRNVSVQYVGRGCRRHEVWQTTIDDRTDYFGVRNTDGRIKVYNKALEQGEGSGALTRFEITHSTSDSMVLYSALPVVLSGFDVVALPDDFTAVDYILVDACIHNPDYIPYLRRAERKYKRLKDYILGSGRVDFDIGCIGKVLSGIMCYSDPNMYGVFDVAELDRYCNSLVRDPDLHVNPDTLL